MIVFRLAKAKYSNDLSGKGAEKAGGRWNSKGFTMVYTSDSRALCTTEIAVHMALALVPKDYKIITIEIPNSLKIEILKPARLPKDWNSIPHSASTQKLGNEFIKKVKTAVLQVPSVVVAGDFNYLLNYSHPDFNKIKILKIEDFNFDERLFLK